MSRKPIVAVILASSFAVAGGAAFAQSGQQTRPDASRSASGVEFTSGGVGLNARQQLAAQAGQFNLHLEFAYAPGGEFLSGVQVDIADARGNSMLSTTTEGPWLLARLPAGNYTVKARFGDVTRTQQVNVGPGKRRIVMRFPAGVEQQTAGTSGTSGASLASR